MPLRRNTSYNILGSGLPLIIGVFTIPVLLSRLGIERFGILTILWAIIGYFSLFDLGLGRATTQQIAASLGRGRHNEIQAIIRAGIKLTLVTGLGGSIILAAIAHVLAYKVLNASLSLREEIFFSLLIVAIGIPFATVSSTLRGVLEAYGRFFSSNLVKILLGSSIFVFPLFGVLLHGASLPAVAAWLVAARVGSYFLYWILVRNQSQNTAGSDCQDASIRRKLLSFGGWMTTSNLISPFLVSGDRFIISHLMGASLVAYYTVPFEVLVRLLIVPGAVGSTLLPKLASDFPDKSSIAHDTFVKSMKVTASIMALLCAIASTVGYPLMSSVLSVDFASKAWPLVVILSVGVLANGVAYIPYTALHALGLAKPTAILHVAELVVYIPLIFAFVTAFGLVGAAFAWTMRAVLDCVGLFYLYNKCRPKVQI